MSANPRVSFENLIGNKNIVSYTYDAEGNILSATNSTGTVSFVYDAAGRLVKEIQHGIEVSTSYDAESNVKTLSFLGHTVSYARDALGLPSQINNIGFSYDANGIQTETLYPNTTKEQNTFDAVYNIKKIQTANLTLAYAQDKTGLITSKNNINYTYDDIGRLIQAGSDTFTYDKAGNNLNRNAIYNILNNRFQTSDLYTVTYDAMGNTASKTNRLTKETSYYTFNARNQLIRYERQNENNETIKTLSFTYDALGRRVSKTEDGVTQTYLYNGNAFIAILDEQNQVIATITHDESIDTPLSITNQNGTFYYHRDHQGSIIALTDESGNIVESFVYDNHYGKIVEHTKLIETNNPYAYTGRELDTEELYYYRARYYDPTLERFLSEDPIGFLSRDFNFYRYVSNKPINFKDPKGLADVNSGGGGGAGIMFGFGGANAHYHFNCSSNGCFKVTTICGRLGLGIGFNFGAEGNAGIDPNGTYGEDCDGDPKECKYDWSIGIGGDLHFGGAGLGGSAAYGSSGGSIIGDLPIFGGFGLDIGGGIEGCIIISCPI